MRYSRDDVEEDFEAEDQDRMDCPCSYSELAMFSFLPSRPDILSKFSGAKITYPSHSPSLHSSLAERLDHSYAQWSLEALDTADYWIAASGLWLSRP